MMSNLDVVRSGRRRTAVVALVSALVLAAGSLLLVVNYDFHPVPSTVMDPAIPSGQRVLLASLAEGEAVKVGDVVVVESGGWSDEPPGARYTFRVGGVGGDVVTCCDAEGRVLVNGKSQSIATVSGEAPGSPEFVTTVPQGRIFLLGDRRDVARDSRAHLAVLGGSVPLSAVKGRVVAMLTPPGMVPTGDSTSTSFNPFNSSGTYLYAALLMVLGVLGLLYVLALVIPMAFSRSGRSPRW